MIKRNTKTMTKAQCQLVTDPNVTNYIESIATGFGHKYISVGYAEFYSIGIAAACEQAMRYDPDRGVSFITYITPYVIGEMAWYVRKYVHGLYINKRERFFADICSVEELKCGGRNGGDSVNSEEQLSAVSMDEDERQDKIKERVDELFAMLTEDERELLMARYGFADSHGEAMDEYMRKHNIKKSMLYARVKAVEKKIINHL